MRGRTVLKHCTAQWPKPGNPVMKNQVQAGGKHPPKGKQRQADKGGSRSISFSPKEYGIVALRECPVRWETPLLDTPEQAAAYWRQHITAHPYFNPVVECAVVLLVDRRRKLIGHHFVATGTLDTILIHP